MADSDVAPSTSRRIPPAIIGAAVLAAAVIAFVFQNTKSTKVRWLFFTVHAPLWVVLLATGAASLAAGELVAVAIRRARKH